MYRLMRFGFLSMLCTLPSGSDNSTSPWSGLKNPTIRFSSVVFPAPLVPIIPNISPVLMSKSRVSRTKFSPKLFDSARTLIITFCSSFLYVFSRYSFTLVAGHPAFRSNCWTSSREKPFSAVLRICSANASSIWLLSSYVFKKECNYSGVGTA